MAGWSVISKQNAIKWDGMIIASNLDVYGGEVIAKVLKLRATDTAATDMFLVYNSLGNNIFKIRNALGEVGQISLFKSDGTQLIYMNASGTGEAFFSTTGGAINAASQVQIDSTTKTFVVPRMTLTQQNAIASPVSGSIIFNTTSAALCYYNATGWKAL